jgi:hypothetical protein
LATITGRTVSSLLPPCDTPRIERAFPAHPDGLSQAELARAVPAASRRIRNQRQALRAGLGCPDLAGVRADFRAHLADWWRIHVNHASWGTPGGPPKGTTQPTRARVCELAGISISTYKACRRWWEARGYIAIVRRGWTPALRAAALISPEDRNERQVYVLCTPRKTRPAPAADSGQTLTRPLTRSRRDPVRNPARARENPPASPAPERPPPSRSWPLGGISDGWWANLTRPFAVAGWTFSDLTWAIDHEPGGRQHRQRLANVRHPAGWLRWRLAHWRGPAGSPLPSRTAQLAAAAAAHRADQARRRETDPVMAARADQLRQAAAAALEDLAAAGQAPAGQVLAALRARLGAALGPRWRDPAELAAQQAAESRAARAAAAAVARDG